MILPALVVLAAWLLRTGHVRSVVFLDRRDARQPRPASGVEAVLRPAAARARVVAGPAATTAFPSGHTLNAVVFYGGVALVVWSLFGRRAGLAAVAAAAVVGLAVGVSRIYLGYHFLTDVAGGILAGIAWLLVVGAAFRARPTWRRWRSRRDGPAIRGARAGGDGLPMTVGFAVARHRWQGQGRRGDTDAILLAILLPPIGMLSVGKVFQALLCLILMFTVLGWPFASIWALLTVHSAFEDRRTERIIRAQNEAGNG